MGIRQREQRYGDFWSPEGLGGSVTGPFLLAGPQKDEDDCVVAAAPLLVLSSLDPFVLGKAGALFLKKAPRESCRLPAAG